MSIEDFMDFIGLGKQDKGDVNKNNNIGEQDTLSLDTHDIMPANFDAAVFENSHLNPANMIINDLRPGEFLNDNFLTQESDFSRSLLDEQSSYFVTSPIIDLRDISNLVESVENLNIANDGIQQVFLSSNDILDHGDILVIDGSHIDSVVIEDAGWMHVDDDPQLAIKDGYDAYVHESGAMIMVDANININFGDCQ